jgi:aryl-phospho-beta-D-glucosidase BglC (GH1 family)
MRRKLARAAVVALVGLALVAGGVGTEPRAEPAADRAAPNGLLATQVTAHDGKFWQGTKVVKLRGMNVAHQIPTASDLSDLADWGFNALRYQFHWAELETTAPKKVGGVWQHTWNVDYLDEVKDFIADASSHGIQVIVDNHGCGGCNIFNFPLWLYTAPYNSKGKTYAQTEAGVELASGDFWSDALRQQFMTEMWDYVAEQLDTVDGIVGYEVLNEPKQGYLENTHATTNLLLDVQLDIAKVIRGSDPARIVFFTTRAGYGPGVTVADFSAWENLGNVAFDVHDYFGGRWGDGLGGEVEGDADYQEVIQLLYNHILADEGVPPYGGTAQVQAEFMGQAEEHLDEYGIPLLIGEAGDYVTDPGAAAFFATMTGAANYLGVSWLVSAFEGELGIFYEDGSFKPYTQIVIDAAQAP